MRFTAFHLRLFVARFMLATSRCGSRLSRLTNLPCDWSKLDRWISDHDARLSPACQPTNVGSSFWRRATNCNSSALALVRLRDPCVNGARAGSSPPRGSGHLSKHPNEDEISSVYDKVAISKPDQCAMLHPANHFNPQSEIFSCLRFRCLAHESSSHVSRQVGQRHTLILLTSAKPTSSM